MSTVRNALSRRPLLAMAGALVSGILVVVGCGDTSSPTGTSPAAGQAGMTMPSGGSSPAGGVSGGGTGGAVTAGSGGSLATSAGTGAGGAGTAGALETAGGPATAGSGGSGGGVCPAQGEAGAIDSGLDPAADQDNDGVPNCLDRCPVDALKSAPGACGCGVLDQDTDQDGTPDCKDECPNDKNKIAVGVCGCENSDTANADNDAVVDCKDACPKDPLLTQAGPCGCLPASLGTLCLAHRYKFDGTGTVAADSIASTSGDATVVGAQLSGTGTVALIAGTTEQYVQLPASLISALGDSATFEAWVTWSGGGEWQRLFDFGTSDAGAGQRGKAAGTLFLTPRAGNSGLRAAISPSDFTQETVAGIDTALPASAIAHLAVVIDATGGKLSLYLDGVIQGTAASLPPWVRLSLLNDTNNWLGRSQYTGDPAFAGTLHEFRIYSRALTASEIMANFTAGPDTLP